MEERVNSRESSALPSFNGSVRTATAAQAYRRVQRVVRLQWRGIAVVLLIVTDAVFFAIIFVYLDQSTQLSGRNLDKARPWLFCLVLNQGDKNQCMKEARQVVLGEPAIMAVLILLSMNGIWCLLFLGRKSMIRGWREWFAKRFRRRDQHQQEFVSIDARRFSNNSRTYEMLQSPSTMATDKKSDNSNDTPPTRQKEGVSSDVRVPERVFTPPGSVSVSVTSEVHVTETVRVDYYNDNEKGNENDTQEEKKNNARSRSRPVTRERRKEEEQERDHESERDGRYERYDDRDITEEKRRSDDEYFGSHPEDVIYRSPPQWSFSSPRPPKSPPRREWDPALTYAPSMSNLASRGSGSGSSSGDGFTER
ncbi:MAG: hypothetical protein M1823_003610 [Watsoniomyces obsoletus]|nr:MAG: hypothetical protein M1823_003610 [Watsoniomyces obsoletus]